MKKLLLLLLLSISYISYADSVCTFRGNKMHCVDINQPMQPMQKTDMVAAGIGLRNILNWLNDYSKTNKNTSSSSKVIPPNASPSTNGWLCDYNYHINSSYTGCQKVPANAYSLKNNNNWSCISGYIKSGNSCSKLPSNAYASVSGEGFLCKSGYKKSGNSCIKSSNKNDVNSYYEFEAEYQAQQARLAEGKTTVVKDKLSTKLPANAHEYNSNYLGWQCNSGYYMYGNGCRKVPENAYASGTSWKCNSGYTKSDNNCIKNQNTAVVEESTDYIEELKKIKELLDSGIINEEDFEKMKQKIIDNM